jgi:O-antigen ligase
MNTYGFWSTSRDPHNQYFGWLAELGLLGLAAVLGPVVLMTRRCRLQRRERWQRGVVLAIAFGGMLGPMVLALPCAAFFALQLRSRWRAP